MSVTACFLVGVGRVFIHPASINFNSSRFDSGWLVYTEILETAKIYVRESSMVPVYALLLFSGEHWAVVSPRQCLGQTNDIWAPTSCI